jgi:hypothetical protein
MRIESNRSAIEMTLSKSNRFGIQIISLPYSYFARTHLVLILHKHYFCNSFNINRIARTATAYCQYF